MEKQALVRFIVKSLTDSERKLVDYDIFIVDFKDQDYHCDVKPEIIESIHNNEICILDILEGQGVDGGYFEIEVDWYGEWVTNNCTNVFCPETIYVWDIKNYNVKKLRKEYLVKEKLDIIDKREIYLKCENDSPSFLIKMSQNKLEEDKEVVSLKIYEGTKVTIDHQVPVRLFPEMLKYLKDHDIGPEKIFEDYSNGIQEKLMSSFKKKRLGKDEIFRNKEGPLFS